jgi:hypothetical protein
MYKRFRTLRVLRKGVHEIRTCWNCSPHRRRDIWYVLTLRDPIHSYWDGRRRRMVASWLWEHTA